jgi:hypothetical protein
MLNAFSLAHLIGDLTSTTVVVANRHSSAANATQYQSLEQSRTFPRWTFPTIMAEGLRILPQSSLILFVLLPRDVPRVNAGQQDPLLSGNDLARFFALYRLANASPPVNKGTRITWVVQHLQRTMML